MEVKPGYKQTDAGVIPDDWEASKVGFEFEIRLGKMLDAEKNTGVLKPYVGNKAVQWNRIDFSDLSTMAMSRSDLERFRLRHGDLLVCEGGEVGRAAIWEAPLEECYYQKALHRLRPLRGFNPHLMLAYLWYWTYHGTLADYVSQTSIAHLTKEKFATVPLPVPPPDEQCAITATLSEVDAAISALDQLIQKRRDIKQGTMQELFTGKKRLPGFSGEWQVKKLGEIAEINMGQSPKSANYNTKGNGLPLIQGNADVDNRKTVIRVFTTEVTKKCFKGDVIMSVRAPVGQISKAVFDACLGRGVCAIRFPNEYLYHYLINQEANWAKLSKGSTFDSVNSADVKALEIYLPKDPKEQTAIATILSDTDAEIIAQEQKREKTRAIKQGMMQELLSGRIRLL